MLITKQYVVFGKNGDEIYNQLCMIKNEFLYAGWNTESNCNDTPLFNLIASKNNVRIHVYPCFIERSRGICWDNCWISDKITDEEISNIIMPTTINDTPEIHFF